MKTLILLSLSIFAMAISAEEKKPFSRQVYVVGVGQVKIQLRNPGEPIVNPQRLEVTVKCEKSKKWADLVQYYLCELDSDTFDSATKTLSFKYLAGRVDTHSGDTYCDQAVEQTLQLADVCKPPKTPSK